jgi:hypothetical protein
MLERLGLDTQSTAEYFIVEKGLRTIPVKPPLIKKKRERK